MALKAILTDEEFGALPEGFGEHYEKQNDGRYRLAVESVGGYSLEDVVGLKGALAEIRQKADERKKSLEKFADLDPDKARTAMEKLEEMANWTPDEKVKEQIEAIKSQLTEKYTGEVKGRDDKINHLLRQLEEHLVTAAATSAITKHKGNVDLLLPHVKAAVRMVEDDGKFTARVYGPDGNPKISMKQGSQDLMSIEEHVATMKQSDAFAPAFAGTGATGGGATGSDRPGGHGVPYVMTREQAKDVRAYRAAKEAADKAGRPLQIAD